MSRLTQNNYLDRRLFLRQRWAVNDGAAFGELSLQDQLDLHDYYALSIPVTNEQALQHRLAMTNAFPSLPQKAGRAYGALRAVFDGAPNQMIEGHRRSTTTVEIIADTRHSLRIAGIAHPKPDHYRLARALLKLAIDPKKSRELDLLVKKRLAESSDDPSAASQRQQI